MTTDIPSVKNRITFAAVSSSGYTKLRVTQSTTSTFEYIYGVQFTGSFDQQHELF